MLRILLVFILFVYASATAQSKIYFLPQDAKESREKIVDLIDNSHLTIDLAMYNLSYEKLINSLESAAKRGVVVRIYLDASKANKNNAINKKFKKSGISYKILDKKNHLKVALFDKEIAIFGSANWTKKSFEDNYELIFMTSDTADIEKIKSIFIMLEEM